MPFFVNGTHISSAANTSTSLSNYTLAANNTSVTGWYDLPGNLGYGIGRILRNAFDQVWGTWQNWWNPAPSQDEIALQKQVLIYKQGLAECLTHLDRAIDNLRKNPNDPQSLEKIKKLAASYDRYVKPAPTEELKKYQQKSFQPIEEKIEKFASHRLKQTVIQLLPLLNSNESEPVISAGKRAVAGTFPAVFDLNMLDGSNGFVIPGVVANGYLGSSVSSAGDVNGDGLTDLVLGAAYQSTALNGTSYVLFGTRSGFPSLFNLANLNGSNGYVIPGIATNGELGFSVSGAGDVNGDGIADLVLGASGTLNGTSYVLFGTRSGFPPSFDLVSLNGSNGFVIPGVLNLGVGLGWSVSGAGDINGDGIADLVLGAPFANLEGMSYVLFGSRGGFPPSFNLANLNGSNGFVIPGVVAGGQLSYSVSTAGDINGDNISDIVLGAPYANSQNGTSYVIFGQNALLIINSPTPTPSPTPFSSSLTPCPSTQALELSNNAISITNGQNLRLTPNDLSASCGNTNTPNLGTEFTVTGITHAQFKTRNSSGSWNNALSFLGSDLSQGNVELIQDNSTSAPEINFTITDGQTTLSAAANVQFSTVESVVQVTSIAFEIQSNGTTILNPQQFQLNATGTKLDDVVISVASVQGGYFTTVNNPSQSLIDFTYYQLQTGQIQFVHNGMALPDITLSIGDGSGPPVLVNPLITFFGANNISNSAIPIGAVVGSVVGAVALGLGMFGIFKCCQNKEEKVIQQIEALQWGPK